MQNLSRTRVKICGITRPEDAEALDARVDYLGFNFFPGSKRYIDPTKAAPLIAGLRHAEPVGVFVDATPAHIAEVAALTGIRRIQLHGQESWDTLDALSLPVIKAISQTRLEDWGGLKPDWDQHASAPEFFLVDTQASGSFGGTGQPFDWSLLAHHPLPRPFFLAGGLGPENLIEGVRATHPFAVDLNSRVEIAPGIKDLARIELCLQQLTRALA